MACANPRRTPRARHRRQSLAQTQDGGKALLPLTQVLVATKFGLAARVRLIGHLYAWTRPAHDTDFPKSSARLARRMQAPTTHTGYRDGGGFGWSRVGGSLVQSVRDGYSAVCPDGDARYYAVNGTDAVFELFSLANRTLRKN